MATDPFSEVDQEFAQREATLRAAQTGQTQAVVGGQSVPVESFGPRLSSPGQQLPLPPALPPEPLPSASEPPPPRSAFQPDFRIFPGPEPSVPIPLGAMDPFQAAEVTAERETKRRAMEINPDRVPGPLAKALGHDRQPEFLNSVHEFTNAFSRRLSEFLGKPVDVVERELRKAGVKAFDEPGAAERTLKRALKITDTQANTFNAQLGAGSFDAVVDLATLFLAAPTLVRVKGTNVVSRLGRDIGEAVQKLPGTTAATTFGASIGARVAAEDIDPAAALPGAFVGSAAVMAPFRVGAFMGRRVESALEGAFGSRLQPVLQPGADPELARSQARNTLQTFKTDIETLHRQAIDRASTAVDSTTAQTQLRSEIEASRAYARQEETAAWQLIPQNSFEPVELLKSAHALNRSIPPEVVNGRPSEFFTRIHDLYAPRLITLADGSTVTVRPRVTAQRLLDLRHEMLDAAAAARTGATPNRTLATNLNKLQDLVLDTLVKQFPNNPSVADARAMSVLVNDLFTRGAVGRVLRRASTREDEVPAANTMERLLARQTALDQLRQISSQFNRPQVEIEAQTALRALFREAAERSPAQAETFLRHNAAALRTWPPLEADFRQATTNLKDLIAVRANLENSALSRFVGADSQTAVQNVVSAVDPAAAANNIMLSIRRDPDAVRGFQSGILQTLLQRTNRRADAFNTVITSPRTNRMLHEIWSPQEVSRLQRMASQAARIERGEEKWRMRDILRSPILLSSRVIGAVFGSGVSHIFGGAAPIQAPAIMSGVARDRVSEFFMGLPAHEWLSRAMRDPRWERMLNIRVNPTPRDIRKVSRRLRTFIKIEHGVLSNIEGNERLTRENEP